MGGFLCKGLFELDSTYNRIKRHNCNFCLTQIIRLGFMIIAFVMSALFLYVWTKNIFEQL